MVSKKAETILQRMIDRLDQRICALTEARQRLTSLLENSPAAKSRWNNSDMSQDGNEDGLRL